MSISGNVQLFSNTPTVDRNAHFHKFVYHEEHMERKWETVNKNDPEAQKKCDALQKKGWKRHEDNTAIYYMEPNRKPVCFYTEFDGTLGELNDYVNGVYVDDGQVVKQISPPHYRTYVMGQPGSEGNPKPDLSLSEHENELVAKLKERDQFSEVRKISWAEMKKLK